MTTAVDEAVFAETATLSTEPNLYEIQLGEGDHGGINIAWLNQNNGAELILDHTQWLSQGYDGVRFVGQGIDKTRMRCAAWDGNTVAVRQHNGIVEIKDCTIYSGNDKGIAFGEQNTDKNIDRDFCLRLENVRLVAPPPHELPDQRRTKWMVFGYQADLVMKNVTIEGKEAVEHNVYFHGLARRGILVEGCNFKNSGAEGLKLRSDNTETAWVGPDAAVIVRDTSFADWYQPWSWRGGAGIVMQGAASHILVERCKFFPGEGHSKATASRRSYCIAVSSEGQSYDIDTGVTGGGHGNGYVLVKNCAMSATGPGPDWYATIMRVGRNGGSQKAAKGVLIEGCGVYGERMSFQTVDVDLWSVVGCNTPSIKEFCSDKLGMDVSHEAEYFSSGGLKPFSEDKAFA